LVALLLATLFALPRVLLALLHLLPASPLLSFNGRSGATLQNNLGSMRVLLRVRLRVGIETLKELHVCSWSAGFLSPAIE
jgi:hypothetical protein